MFVGVGWYTRGPPMGVGLVEGLPWLCWLVGWQGFLSDDKVNVVVGDTLVSCWL